MTNDTKALEGKNVKDLLLNVGSGGGAAAAPAVGGAAGGGAAAAEEEKEEEPKEEGELTEDELQAIQVAVFSDLEIMAFLHEELTGISKGMNITD